MKGRDAVTSRKTAKAREPCRLMDELSNLLACGPRNEKRERKCNPERTAVDEQQFRYCVLCAVGLIERHAPLSLPEPVQHLVEVESEVAPLVAGGVVGCKRERRQQGEQGCKKHAESNHGQSPQKKKHARNVQAILTIQPANSLEK